MSGSKNGINVVLVGNPNTGKSSLFNQLTGLNQKVGNYPGITVEKKIGRCRLPGGERANIIDMPGSYSINPSSADEDLVLDSLIQRDKDKKPDVVVVVADVVNLKRNLFLLSQVMDLGFRTILAINMSDQMKRRGIDIDISEIEKAFGCSVVLISTKKKTGLKELKSLIESSPQHEMPFIFDLEKQNHHIYTELHKIVPEATSYQAWLCLSQLDHLNILDDSEVSALVEFKEKQEREIKRIQHKETIKRYSFINRVLKKSYSRNLEEATGFKENLDRIMIHRVWGYVIFVLVLLLIFQAVYSWASFPMDLIDTWFAQLAQWTKSTFPEGPFTNLLADGIIAGLGGIVIFIPQIALLFFFIALLEESGYMSRVVFLMDRIMRNFGLSGKSVVPLISGTACAIPAVMAARNIENWKERLITILVTPFTTCSARLPVYTIIIALVIPERTYFGLVNLQGLALFSLYFLGFAAALISSYFLNMILKFKTKSYFVVEMPELSTPMIRNVGQTVYQKTQAFVLGAGKIILAISVVLWVLSSYGPGENFKNAEQIVSEKFDPSAVNLEAKISSYKLENSYIGIAGKFIEPVIRPLGYDWKIGIALICSFAAREVFVGALSTIYSVGNSSDEDIDTIKKRLEKERNPVTGQKMYTLPLGISLLLFYAFAMQCMSTLAVVKRETNSWKWPLLQLIVMTGIAYLSSLIAYNLLI